MTVETLDEAALVCVAALVLDQPPEHVLARSDVASLARIAAAQERCDTSVDAAAAVLVGIVRERPFPAGNHAAAWLATAHLTQVDMTDAQIAGVLDGAERRTLDHATVARLLLEHQRPTTAQRLGRWLSGPARPWPEPGTDLLPCPACGRTVERTRWGGAWAGAPRDELVALCARQHHEHGRRELATVG